MKKIINLFDSEIRAMAHAQMELYDQLVKKQTYTNNEKRIKEVLNEKLYKIIDSITTMQELLNKLKNIDEFELLHVVDIEEDIINGL